MVLDYLFLLFLLGTTSYAAYLDLKTSEVPDSISLLIGGVAVLYYLGQSIAPAALQRSGTVLIAATLLLAAGVATYLKLYRLFEDHDAAARIAAVLDGHVGPFRTSDVAGTVLFLLAGGLYYYSVLLTGITPIVRSVAAGTVLFALGWSMYLAGMWGGADAFVLGAVGYALPVIPDTIQPLYPSPFPTPLSLLITVFLVGSLYSIGYATYKALQDTAFMEQFWQTLWRDRRRIGGMVASFFAALLVIGYGMQLRFQVPRNTVITQSALFSGVFAALLVLYRFLRLVEQEIMHRTVPVDDLEPGDVPAEDLELGGETVDATKIVGLTEDQVEQVRDRYDAITVKTGVRFIVSFPVAILLLLTVGDPLYSLSTFLL